MNQSKFVSGLRSILTAILLVSLIALCTGESKTPTFQPDDQSLHFAQERSISIFYGVTGASRASGFLLNDGKSIVSVLHASPPIGKSIYVATTGDAKRIPAKIVLEEPRIDLMILRTMDSLPVSGEVRWKGREELTVGEPLFLVGAPHGLGGSLLLGYLSHKDRLGVDVQFETVPFLQSMGLSYPGTSGAAVYDRSGAIVGINRATYGTSAGNGIGLIIPATYVKVFLEQKYKPR